MKRLLITDDDANNRTVLNHYLTKQGFLVLEAANGSQAMRLLQEHPIDLAIFDVMLPEVDGFSLCEYTRHNYDIPIILLTARDQLRDKELGYSCGADDYVTKPYEMPELLFRIKALFRRYLYASSDKIRLTHRFVIDRRNYEIQDGDELLILPLKEFELLAQLAEYPGRVFTRDELIRLVWGPDYSRDERTVDVHVKRLRKRFVNREHEFVIQTVRGVGYKLEVTGT